MIKWNSSIVCDICGANCKKEGKLYDCITNFYAGITMCKKCKVTSPYQIVVVTEYETKGDDMVKVEKPSRKSVFA